MGAEKKSGGDSLMAEGLDADKLKADLKKRYEQAGATAQAPINHSDARLRNRASRL
jgi:hypothetical protein